MPCSHSNAVQNAKCVTENDQLITYVLLEEGIKFQDV